MKASKAIIAELNKILGSELISINQYFLHARILKNWGLEALGKQEYKESIDAMKEADKLIERILFLEGLPNLQHLGKLNIGQNVPEILESDLKHESTLRRELLAAIAHCERESDFVSRELLAKILEESEERIDFIENQLELTHKMGLENYLQSAASEVAK